MKTLSPILNPAESKRYAELRAIIKKQQAAFWEFAEALAEIRAERLYREKYETFDGFCAAECGFTRQRAQQLIAAAKYREDQKALAEQGEPAQVPETEREARQMMGGESQAQAAENDVRTSPDKMSTVVDNSSSPEVKKPSCDPQQAPAPPVEEDTKGKDRMGFPLPKAIAESFEGWHEIQKLVDRLRGIKFHVEDAKKNQNPLYAHLSRTWVVDLENLISSLRNSMPYAVCPYCQGRNAAQCTNCHHTGFVGEFFYNHAVTSELKMLRDKQISSLR